MNITLENIGSIANPDTFLTALNSNFSAITSAFQVVLQRTTDYTGDDFMTRALDMNGYPVINVSAILTVDNPTLDAINVGIADAGNYYTGIDLEAVLQEIGAQLGGGGPFMASTAAGQNTDVVDPGVEFWSVTVPVLAAGSIIEIELTYHSYNANGGSIIVNLGGVLVGQFTADSGMGYRTAKLTLLPAGAMQGLIVDSNAGFISLAPGSYSLDTSVTNTLQLVGVAGGGAGDAIKLDYATVKAYTPS